MQKTPTHLSLERELVWSDEFEGPTDAGVDPEKWIHQMGRSAEGWAGGVEGWGNRGIQYYTDRSENVRLNGNGELEITALKESYEGADYTSARLITQGLASFQYGRIEARIKLPEGQGLWPAFWMIGDNHPEVDGLLAEKSTLWKTVEVIQIVSFPPSMDLGILPETVWVKSWLILTHHSVLTFMSILLIMPRIIWHFMSMMT